MNLTQHHLYATTAAMLLSLSVAAGSIYVTVTAATTQPPEASEVSAESTVVEQPAETTPFDRRTIADVPLTPQGWLTARFSGVDPTTGELQPTSGVEVTVIAADGSRIVALTDANGFVAFDVMEPGVFIVNASSPQGMLSYGIRTVPSNATARNDDAVVNGSDLISMTVQLDSALTPERDRNAVDEILRGTAVRPVEGAVGRLGQVASEYGDLLAANAGNTRDPRTYIEYDPRGVQLTPEGSLRGQLALMNWQGNIVPVNDLTAHFVDNGTVVARTRINRDGSFEQWNLLPGTYSLVIAGSDAFGCIGIDVIAAPGNEDAGHFIPTAALQLPPYEFGLVHGAWGFASGDDLADEGPLPPMYGLGGAPGYGYGAGGGIPGGGGWGELLGAAALGLGAAALLNDDDSNNVASPSM